MITLSMFVCLNLKLDSADALPLRLLKNSGPSAISIELTNLAPEGGGSNSLLLAFIRMIDSMLASGRDFDLAHGYLALFLKVGICLSSNIIISFFFFFMYNLLYIYFFCFSFTSGCCRWTLLPRKLCYASHLVWKKGGRSYGRRLTNRCVCSHMLRVLYCNVDSYE